MKCPTCLTPDLLMTERLNVEIDYCPQCRGVWLDRGELDKIIERSMRDAVPTANVAPQAQAQPVPVPMPAQYDPRYDQRYAHRDGHHGEQHGYPQKKSIWKELFD